MPRAAWLWLLVPALGLAELGAMAEGVRMSAEEAVRSGMVNILFSHRPEEEAAAIDAYLKSLQPVPSPRLIDGRLSPAAERGRELFESDRVGCARYVGQSGYDRKRSPGLART